MRYWPVASLTTERTFSINAGLAASTVTPGSTAPEASLTTPAIPLAWACCADALSGTRNVDRITPRANVSLFVRSIVGWY